MADTDSGDDKRPVLPSIYLNGTQRYAAGFTGGLMVIFAGLMITQGRQGVAVTAFVLSGLVLGVIGLLGMLPSRMSYKDASFELMERQNEVVDTVVDQIADQMNPEQMSSAMEELADRESSLPELTQNTSPEERRAKWVNSAARTRLAQHMRFERSASDQLKIATAALGWSVSFQTEKLGGTVEGVRSSDFPRMDAVVHLPGIGEEVDVWFQLRVNAASIYYILSFSNQKRILVVGNNFTHDWSESIHQHRRLRRSYLVGCRADSDAIELSLKYLNEPVNVVREQYVPEMPGIEGIVITGGTDQNRAI